MTATLDARMTVGRLVTEGPHRSRVFEMLQIDYCCGGGLPLVEACRSRGLDPQAVVEQLLEADTRAENDTEAVVDADAMSLTGLADHIEQEHHAYLRTELPRLDQMIEKVLGVHGEKDPRLAALRTAFCALRDELTSHMIKEEQILFPMVRQLEESEGRLSIENGSIAAPIRQIESEHDHAGAALAIMRTATDDFEPPEWACNTYRTMLDALSHLERDLHHHIHKENNILFPKALALEAQLQTRWIVRRTQKPQRNAP